ncbi:MAG: AMP-binding protein [Deltaproteobacteria bacterium]|nr:AMP-binding protein [Deltaproteobacteria bacterium]
MDHRWYQVWPVWVPKTFEVDRPTSEYIREWAGCRPESIAVSFYGQDITYRELDGLIDRLAWGLVDLGVGKGDRVAIHLDNCPQFVIAYFAVQRAGAMVVPVNPMLKHAELEHEINDAGAETLIGLDYLYPEVEKVRSRTTLKNVIITSLGDFLPEDPLFHLPPEAGKAKPAFSNTIDFLYFINKSKNAPICRVHDLKTDLALLIYTGGTTGTPKGVMINHHALSCVSIGAMHWYHLREDDVFLGVTPFFHIMGQIQLMCAPVVAGGRMVILSRYVPDVVAQAITQYRCTHWVAATTMVIALLNLPDIDKYDLTSFRCLWTGGAPISVELQKKLIERLPKTIVGEGYGLSECLAHGGVITPLHKHKIGFVGIPQMNEVRIMDQETGTIEMGPNETGEITIKGPVMMLGYWNKPEETQKVLRDGWFYTGDTGCMDEQGYVKFLGRTKELLKCSGYSVFPTEVENLLYRHPAVQEAAVIGMTDPYRGETPKAFIVLRDEYKGKIREEEIIEWCRENMAAYKRPHFVEFRAHLPKSGAGKLLRRVLIDEEESKSK